MQSLIDDLNTFHVGLFGWPIDHLTPLEDLAGSATFKEAARKLLRTPRAREALRDEVPLWQEDKWVCTEYERLRLWVNLHDSFVSRGVLEGHWEQEEVAFVLDQLGPGDAMLDIGANVGVYTLQAARAVGDTGRVYAFEPQADVFAMLSRSVAENGLTASCVLHNLALGDRDAGASIWRHHHTNPGASFVTQSEVGQHGNPIQVCRLDSLEFDRRVKLVKMDVEGYEPLVVAGGEAFFRRHRPVVITEWFPRSMRSVAGSDPLDFFDRLSAAGYAVHGLEGSKPGARLLREDVQRYDAIEEPFNIVCLPD